MFRTIRSALLVATLLLAHTVFASSGTINSDGTIDIRLNLRFPPTPTQLATLQNRITTMSHVLYDATEGQLRLGTVTIDCTNTTADLADYWIVAEGIRSGSGIGTLGVAGAHITEFFDDRGDVYAHEFGHLGFGLGDEYEEDPTLCWGKGFCISESPDATSAENQCLMQQTPERDGTELCVSGNHDPLKGDNTTCLVGGADGAPCTENCQAWNTTTHRMESSQQEQISHQSCWQTMTSHFPFLSAPTGAPVVAEPAGWAAPTFTMTCASASTLLLVLDRSGSMGWNVNDDWGEVCGNGADDDFDGTVDETQCEQARIQFLRAAGRSVLQLASTDPSVRAGILSFATMPSPSPDAAIQNVSMNLASLQGTVDGLTPGGETAIGDALASAKTTLDLDSAAAASKAVVIITDGVNTNGSAPDSAVPSYQAAGIRIFTISTGGASNSATLSSISSNTRGYRVDEPDGTALVTALAELWAFYTNGGVVFPQTPYAVNAAAQGQSLPIWPRVGTPKLSRDFIGDENVVEFDIEDGTRHFTALLAGNMSDMSGFGVRARLVGPGAAVFDTEAPSTGMSVALDPYFTFVRIANPTPGHWRMSVQARGTAAPLQTGTLIVISDNPRTFLYADTDRDVVSAAGETVTAVIHPGYVTGLREPALTARVKRPDGSIVAVPVTRTAQPFVFEARINTFPNRGLYELIVDMQTTSATTNDPGESRPGTLAPASVPIPPIQRSVSTFFFVDFGPWSCNEPDCDHDGIPNESSTTDADGDGIVTSNDNDDNNDDIPDRNQTGKVDFDRRRLLFGGAVGSSHPLGKLDSIADANIYAKLDLDYALTAAFHARLMFGIAQFTAQPSLAVLHPRYHHLSLNAQFLAPISAATRLYVAGGPGWYQPESGGTSGGLNVGAGFRTGAGSNDIELGLDYHWAGDDRRGRFLTWHLGILFR